VPGGFSAERDVCSNWACTQYQSIPQAPVAAHVIDKCIPTTGLLAQVLVGKDADHQPLYRQEAIVGRAGLALARSTLARWLGTCGVRLQPLVMLPRPKCSGSGCCTPMRRRWPCCSSQATVRRTGPTYGLTYAPGVFEDMKAVVYDFCDARRRACRSRPA
jgi:transposase